MFPSVIPGHEIIMEEEDIACWEVGDKVWESLFRE